MAMSVTSRSQGGSSEAAKAGMFGDGQRIVLRQPLEERQPGEASRRRRAETRAAGPAPARAPARPTPRVTRRCASPDMGPSLHRLQRRQHVLDDIVGMFEADRNADQAVGDARVRRVAAGASRWWVVVAGCVIRLFASPRLLLMRMSLSASSKRNAAALPPLMSKATSVEPPRICFFATLACG